MNRIIGYLGMTAVSVALLSSCDSFIGSAEPTTFHGFDGLETETVYANTPKTFVTFLAYGDWNVTKTEGVDWCTFDKTQGVGGYWYYINVTCKPNTTGQWRYAKYKLQDKDDTDVTASFGLFQYATRGDGSMGGSPLVKTVTGDDGSLIELEYDGNDCVSALKMTKNGTVLRDLHITYASDSVMHVSTGASVLKAKYDMGFQMAESNLCSETDTFGVTTQSDLYVQTAFMVKESKSSGEYNAQSLLFLNQKFGGDNEHCADSLRYQRRKADGSVNTVKMKLSYSDYDNRYQSIDVNQLLLGIEECNPYNLLCFFRHTRNSKVLKGASTADGNYTVDTKLNTDKSVRTLAVIRPDGTKVTYTFAYYDE